jgi:hypothetical protein
MMEYDIHLAEDDPGSAETATVNRVAVHPIRFFYEVGLRDDINEENVKELVPDNYADKDGIYTFYTNAWTKDAAQTLVTLNPSEENEFYYYFQNTDIYEKTSQGDYIRLKTKPDSNKIYYYNSQLFNTQSAKLGSKTDVKQLYKEIGSDVIEMARKDDEEGYWFIPKGTPKTTVSSYVKIKEKNLTDTYPNAWEPGTTIERSVKMSVLVELGNNGLIRLRSRQTGHLAVNKTVTGTGERDRDFAFTVTLNEEIDGQYGQLIFEAGVARFTLKHSETITASELPAGVSYTVIEADYSGDGYVTRSTGAAGIIKADSTATAAFQNTQDKAAPPTGDDNSLIWLSLILIVALILLLLCINLRKRSIK